jgi:hypothetical protein
MVIRTASIPRVAALHTLESMRDVDPAEVPHRGYLGRIRRVKRSNGMRNALVATLFVLLASPLAADCIANGHYSLVASAFPYTEDLTHPGSAPVHDGVWIPNSDDWTLIQTACSDETNVNASTDVSLLVRASFRLGKATAAPDAIFDVQLRVDGQTIATHSRRVGDLLPKAYRFAGSMERLGAGNHLLTMWLRLRNPGAIFIGLQWITAQGSPADYGGNRAFADNAAIGGDWTPIGPPLAIHPNRPIDASLQASFTIASASGPLTFAWSVDDEAPHTRTGTIAAPLILPDGVTIFDHHGRIDRGPHTLRLWGRAAGGGAELASVTVEAVGFPHEMNTLRRPLQDEEQPTETRLPPLAEAEADTVTLATTAGDAQQPLAMSEACGRWTKLLEFDLPPSSRNYSWSLDGFIELLAHDISGYGQLGMEIDSDGAHTDVGMFDFQVSDQHDGIYFYGDCGKWMPGSATHVSLWIRRIEGCGIAPVGGSFLVGRRWLAVKLLPAQAPLLP